MVQYRNAGGAFLSISAGVAYLNFITLSGWKRGTVLTQKSVPYKIDLFRSANYGLSGTKKNLFEIGPKVAFKCIAKGW